MAASDGNTGKPLGTSSCLADCCSCARSLTTSASAECSPIQSERREWRPVLPSALRSPVRAEIDASAKPEVPDAAVLAEQFPQTWGQRFVKLVADNTKDFKSDEPLRVGVVLSGGQAAGGHNVIAGIFDYVKQRHPDSMLIGFKSGPHGIFTHNYMEITPEYLYKYRNMGGFDMICSGRHKIETEEQKRASLEVCEKLKLHGLVIIGGDDSNTNGAILAEYFKANGCKTLVAGAPKTIDGDLKNEYIEISFGFDTAIKVYSELVGNLCTDAQTHKDRYHFVRLMGRSATNIGLEVALQTRANLCFIGEEIQLANRSLASICGEIADMVEKRHALGRNYGVVLLPEGLIEFIPEVGTLISEINDILGDGSKAFDANLLSANSRSVFDSLPAPIRAELLLERDSHGNVQVAKIATERLLILMTQTELQRRGFKGPFVPHDHYFGYEGRCAMPSNFDANYCYALGHTAAALINNGLTGYMAVVRHLDRPSSEWEPAGCPVTIMMNVERRKGKNVPVIKKYLVDLEAEPFTTYKEVREILKTEDLYRSPGSIQFCGPSADISNFMICRPSRDLLLNRVAPNSSSSSTQQCSSLPEERSAASVCVPTKLREHGSGLKPTGSTYEWTSSGCNLRGKRIGVCCLGPAYPGARNILGGILAKATIENASVVVYNGCEGLIQNKGEVLTSESKLNIGGFDHCGPVTRICGHEDAVVKTVGSVDGMIFLGDSIVLNDLMKLHLPNCSFVPLGCDNSICGEYTSSTVGFDTVSKTYASLVGNLLTDAKSAHKYWYFVKVMGSSALSLEVAAQTHSNHMVFADPKKQLSSVVREISEVVAARAAESKNFGCVLLPECIACCSEPLASILRTVDSNLVAGKSRQEAVAAVASEIQSWPDFFRDALLKPTPSGRVELSEVPIDQLLAYLVADELKKSDFQGAFSPVSYYMGLQARGAIPSQLDCSLGATHGYLAVMAVAAHSPSLLVTCVKNLSNPSPENWSMHAVPASAMMGDVCPASVQSTWMSNHPIYMSKDTYCNPGPIQFTGRYSTMVAKCIIARDSVDSTCMAACKLQQTSTDVSDAVVHA